MINIYIVSGIALTAFVGGWQTNGWRLESIYKEQQNKAIIAAVQEERKDAKAVNDLMVGYEVQKVQNEQKRKETRDNIRNGAITLSVPVQACYLPAAPTDTASPAPEARADINPEAAQRIIDIAQDGDRAIEQCNQLIDLADSLGLGIAIDGTLIPKR